MVISTEIIQSVMIPLLVAFAISVALSPFVIPSRSDRQRESRAFSPI